MINALALKNVAKTFEGETQKKLLVLDNVSFDVKDGELFIFLGPSGAGKSTLLRIMSGLEKDYSGKIEYGDGILPKDCSFVFQQFALLPWLTVYKNIEMGLIARKMLKHEREERVERELKVFGLKDFASSYPRELSGGMKQRVGLARAFVSDPKIIFMDEPFSELDSFTAQTLREELLAIWQERKMTIIMVTHLISEALELGDHIAVLTSRPARIEKIVVNSLVRPRQKRTPSFWQLEDELHGLVKP